MRFETLKLMLRVWLKPRPRALKPLDGVHAQLRDMVWSSSRHVDCPKCGLADSAIPVGDEMILCSNCHEYSEYDAAPKRAPYTIGRERDHYYIQCNTCGLRSFHREDIRNKFCGFCDAFHQD